MSELVEQVSESIVTGDFSGFVTGANWTSKLWQILKTRRKRYAAQLEELNRITLGDPLFLARYYVEPDCQEWNPADRQEEDFLVSREPVFKKLAEFFRARSFQRGSNQLFVLSDAGMGKTSLLTMLKLLHMNKFWPSSMRCEIMKLGVDTLDAIKRVEKRRNSILLLDALDEDRTSYGRVEARLAELLDETADFNKVVITCRTQFFPELRHDPLERPGQVVIGGYTCPTKYISNFDDEKVDKYLAKRFRQRLRPFIRNVRREQAKRLVDSMGSLRCRPMLLAHIDDLLKSPKIVAHPGEFEIYRVLVRVWLDRQEAKSKVPAATLWQACEVLANRMQSMNTRVLALAELTTIRASIQVTHSLEAMDLEGRSLLNRTSDGKYRFSHYSIQEFLAAFGALHAEESTNLTPFRATTFIAHLIMQESLGNRALQAKRLDIVDFSQADLRHINLQGRDLQGVQILNQKFDHADFSGANLSKANLTGCSFTNCKFVGAVIDEATLDRANLSGSDLTEASLEGIRASGADLRNCLLYMTNLSNSNFQTCNFQGSSALGWASFSNSVIETCDFTGTDWSGPNYRVKPDWINLPGAEVIWFGRKALHSSLESIKSVAGTRFTDAHNQCEKFREWAQVHGAES